MALVDDATVRFRANSTQVERRAIERFVSAMRQVEHLDVAAMREYAIEVANIIGISYGEAQALLAAEYYDDLRAASGAAGEFTAAAIVELDGDEIRKNMGWAVDPLNNEDSAGALERMQSVVTGMLTQVSARTIQGNVDADPSARGWHRIARATGCNFCVMLSQRGAVYTRKSVDFAAHGHCHCTAKPSWDMNAPEVDVRAYEASKRTAHMRELDAADGGTRYEDHKANVNSWMASESDLLDAFRAELT